MTDAPPRPLRATGDVAGALAALRAAGHRASTPARLVLEALFAADGPVSAERIATVTRLEATSVYRNLVRFQDLGLVGHVHIGHGAGLWALSGDGPREYLVCERCSRVTTVDAASLDPVREQIHDAFGYRVRFSHFPLHGYCAACAETMKGGEVPPPHDHRPRGATVSGHDDEHTHDAPHSHVHTHDDGTTHSHAHSEHDHEHVEHEHEHSHGDVVHSHPHVHEDGLEHVHVHEHE